MAKEKQQTQRESQQKKQLKIAKCYCILYILYV